MYFPAINHSEINKQIISIKYVINDIVLAQKLKQNSRSASDTFSHYYFATVTYDCQFPFSYYAAKLPCHSAVFSLLHHVLYLFPPSSSPLLTLFNILFCPFFLLYFSLFPFFPHTMKATA